MKFKLLVALLLINLVGSTPQAFAKADVEDIEQNARAMSKAMVSTDWESYEHYVLPIVVQNLGGRDQFIKSMKKNTDDMTHEGSHIDAVEVSKPARILGTGANLQAIVPMTITIRIPDGILTRKGFLVAVSANSGESWSFFDGTAISKDNINVLLPKTDEEAKRLLLEAAEAKQFKETSFKPSHKEKSPEAK